MNVFRGFLDPFRSDGVIEASDDGDAGVLTVMRAKFSHGPYQVLAYLLFILLYVPCLAALGTAFRELGTFYGTLMTVFQTVLGWSLSVLFFQVTVDRNWLWIGVSLGALALMGISLVVMGRKTKKNFTL